MKTIKLSYLILWLLCSATVMGQTKKLEKTYKTNKDVTVNIDARHTNLFVEYWDKNEVQIEAVLESSGTKEEVQKAIQNWKLDHNANGREVNIHSHGGTSLNGALDMAALQVPLSKLPEMLAPLQEMVGPLLESISGNPLPPEFQEGMKNMRFDYEAYQKEGDKYMERFEKEMEKNFGKDFEKSMEEWAAKMERDMEKNFGKDFEKSMEAWGEEFGKGMEKWGEQFGKDMEIWAESFAKEVEAKYGDSESKVIVVNGKGNAPKKILRVKMPRSGQLKLDVRHGEVVLNGTTTNLKANLSHSNFKAGTISGNDTDIKVAYTPVKVKQWNYGMLNASYVQDFTIDKAVSIKLDSNSSDVTINELGETGILKGSFGELVINKLSPSFKNLDISLENSDLKLDIPDTAFNFSYSGTRSKVKFPENLKVKSSNSYDNQKLKGYSKNSSASASININADYSEVLLK